jgi:hypothetical protein
VTSVNTAHDIAFDTTHNVVVSGSITFTILPEAVRAVACARQALHGIGRTTAIADASHEVSFIATSPTVLTFDIRFTGAVGFNKKSLVTGAARAAIFFPWACPFAIRTNCKTNAFVTFFLTWSYASSGSSSGATGIAALKVTKRTHTVLLVRVATDWASKHAMVDINVWV